MSESINIEVALENNDADKIKEFIETGGNIYKECEKEQAFYPKETLLIKALREEKTEIVEILLAEYERDYKIVEKFVSNIKDKEFMLKYIFIASGEEEIQKVIQLSKKTQNNSKKLLVFLADRKECVLISLVEEKALMYKLYKNGLLTINCRDKYEANPGHLIRAINRLDLLKKMVSIGLRFEATYITTHNQSLISQSTCIDLIKYCLYELNLDHGDLLQFTAYNKSIEVFEFLLEYVRAKNDSSNKEEYIQKYIESNNNFFENCRCFGNFELLAHLFTVYKVKFESKKRFFKYLFKEEAALEYVDKILEIEGSYYEDLLDSINENTNKLILYKIWGSFNKYILDDVNKNKVGMIITTYNSPNKRIKVQARENFRYVDPLAIYDKETGNTALFIALEHNCGLLIRNLITRGADLLHRNKEGHTTLTSACKYCSVEIIQHILKMEPNLCKNVGINGYYPLTELIYRDETFIDVFEEVLKSGADFQVQDQEKHTLLHHAVLSQSVVYVKKCLDLGIDPSIKGSKDNTALHLSAKGKSLEIFDLILDSGKVDIETKNYRGYTILHCASKSSLPYFLDSLAQKTKPNMNSRDNSGQTALYCCFDGERFKKLLEMGADTSIVGDRNYTFYSKAASNWKTDILKEVFSNSEIDLSLVADDGETLLQCMASIDMPIDEYFRNDNFKEMFRKCTNAAFSLAVVNSNFSLMNYMFEYAEPQLELKNYLGETAIFANLRSHYDKDVLEYLIEKGADVNAQNNEGNSIIFESVYAEGTEILLKAGASTKIVNKKGESALHLAAKRNDLEICLLLLSYGAEINLEDENKKKPSDLCTYTYLKDFLLYISE